MKILWVSRHPMTQEQLDDLHRIYQTKPEIIQYDHTVKQAEELVIPAGSCDVCAVVLPPELLARLKAMLPDRQIICSVSKRVPLGDGEYRFVHDYWQEIVEMKLEVKRL